MFRKQNFILAILLGIFMLPLTSIASANSIQGFAPESEGNDEILVASTMDNRSIASSGAHKNLGRPGEFCVIASGLIDGNSTHVLYKAIRLTTDPQFGEVNFTCSQKGAAERGTYSGISPFTISKNTTGEMVHSTYDPLQWHGQELTIVLEEFMNCGVEVKLWKSKC